MKRTEVIMLDVTAEDLIEYVHRLDPKRPPPTLGEAASVVIDEWSKHRRALGKFADRPVGPVQVRPVEIEG